MDLAKAKKLIILIFFLLNLFLLYNIVSYRSGDDITKETISNVLNILNERGVVLQCDIPSFNHKTPRLVYAPAQLDKKKLILGLFKEQVFSDEEIMHSKEFVKGEKELIFKDRMFLEYTHQNPNEDFDMKDFSKLEKQLRRFFEDLGFDMGSYILEGIQDRKGNTVSFKFTYEYKKYMIFDSYIEGVISQKGLTYFESNLKAVTSLTSESVEILPVHKLLVLIFKEGSHAIVTKIELGFYNEASSDINDVAEETEKLPVYRIMFQGKDTAYFDASDGHSIELK